MFDIRLKGAASTRRKIKNVARSIEAKNMREELKKAMEPVKTEAQSLVPVDSGALRRTIRIFARGNANKLTAEVKTGTRRQVGIAPDDPYYYPAGLQYGTRKMRARPFLRPAMAAKKKQVLKSLTGSIRRAVLAGGRK